MAYMAPVAQQPVISNQSAVTESEEARNRHKDLLYKLGITELVMGIVFCVACLASIAFAIGVTNQGSASSYYYYTFGIVYVSPGFWCGIFPIVSGILGICARNNHSSCMYVANMVMSIFTALFMTVLFGLSVTSAAVVSHPAIIAFQVLNSIGSFAIIVVSIIHSAYCCCGVCCMSKTQGQVLTTVTPGQQFVQLPNGQYMLVQNQPPVTQTYFVSGAQATVPPSGMHIQTAAVPPPTTSAQYPQMHQYPPANMQQPPLPVDPTKQQAPPMASPPSYADSNYATNPNYPL